MRNKVVGNLRKERWIFRCLVLWLGAKYGGMSVPQAKRLRELEAESAKRKKLLAESLLDAEAAFMDCSRRDSRRQVSHQYHHVDQARMPHYLSKYFHRAASRAAR